MKKIFLIILILISMVSLISCDNSNSSSDSSDSVTLEVEFDGVSALSYSKKVKKGTSINGITTSNIDSEYYVVCNEYFPMTITSDTKIKATAYPYEKTSELSFFGNVNITEFENYLKTNGKLNNSMGSAYIDNPMYSDLNYYSISRGNSSIESMIKFYPSTLIIEIGQVKVDKIVLGNYTWLYEYYSYITGKMYDDFDKISIVTERHVNKVDNDNFNIVASSDVTFYYNNIKKVADGYLLPKDGYKNYRYTGDYKTISNDDFDPNNFTEEAYKWIQAGVSYSSSILKKINDDFRPFSKLTSYVNDSGNGNGSSGNAGQVVDFTNVLFEDKEFEYDGKSHSLEAKNIPSGLIVSYDNNIQSTAGVYNVTANFKSPSGEILHTMKAKLTIYKMYSVRFNNCDNTFLQEVKVRDGQSAKYTGVTPDYPYKDLYDNIYYTHKFSGWDADLTKITKDMIVKAEFSHTPKKTTVTIIYKFFVTGVDPIYETINIEYDGNLLKQIVAPEGYELSSTVSVNGRQVNLTNSETIVNQNLWRALKSNTSQNYVIEVYCVKKQSGW